MGAITIKSVQSFARRNGINVERGTGNTYSVWREGGEIATTHNLKVALDEVNSLIRDVEKKVEFRLGAAYPPLTQQLIGKLEFSALQSLDKDRVAISRLKVYGYLTNAEAKRAQDRLAKRIFKLIKEEAHDR